MRFPGLSHGPVWHRCHRLFLSSVACEMAAPDRQANTSAVKAAVRQEPGAEAHEVPTPRGWAGGGWPGWRQARRDSGGHRQSGGGVEGLATSPLVARSVTGHLALCGLPQAVCAGRLLGKPQVRSHFAHARWRSWEPLTATAVQRGQAFSRSPAKRTWPTRSLRCRGSRAEMADRFTVVAAIAGPKGSGSAWGHRPRPQSRSAWASASSQAQH